MLRRRHQNSVSFYTSNINNTQYLLRPNWLTIWNWFMTVRLFVCFSTQSPGAGIIGTRQPGEFQGLYNLRLYRITGLCRTPVPVPSTRLDKIWSRSRSRRGLKGLWSQSRSRWWDLKYFGPDPGPVFKNRICQSRSRSRYWDEETASFEPEIHLNLQSTLSFLRILCRFYTSLHLENALIL